MPTIGGIVVATGVEATGRRTFLDIIDELARPIDAADSTIRAKAADSFRAAVRRMNRKGLWPWEVQEEELTLTGGQRFSAAQSAIKKPLAMHFLSATGGIRDQRIGYMAYDRFMEMYDHNLQSEPHTYTIPNLFETGQVQWWPTPDSDDYALFTYYRVTPIPRDEQEPVEIPEYVTDVYVAYAWVEFLKRLPTSQRPFDIQVAMAEARAAFNEMSAHVNSTGDRERRTGD